MSEIPNDLRYTKDHEWIREQDDGTVVIGITDYAQGELGDDVYVELPQPGDRNARMDSFGTIEAVKAVSELYSPLAGEIVEINDTVRTVTLTSLEPNAPLPDSLFRFTPPPGAEVFEG